MGNIPYLIPKDLKAINTALGRAFQIIPEFSELSSFLEIRLSPLSRDFTLVIPQKSVGLVRFSFVPVWGTIVGRLFDCFVSFMQVCFQFSFSVLLFCRIGFGKLEIEFCSEILTGCWYTLDLSRVKISRGFELFWSVILPRFCPAVLSLFGPIFAGCLCLLFCRVLQGCFCVVLLLTRQVFVVFYDEWLVVLIPGRVDPYDGWLVSFIVVVLSCVLSDMSLCLKRLCMAWTRTKGGWCYTLCLLPWLGHTKGG